VESLKANVTPNKMKKNKNNKTSHGPLQLWAKSINWSKRVKAACKPCWEIKYCPYGPLVEQLPLKLKPDDKSCRIFGHDCPVFFVAEPLTETKELRNISRSIPRNVQFKVLKRENQICSECGQSVRDEDVEFDHIIPWSKGGCSDEHNVRLLCKTCNRQRGNRFEEKYLIESLSEHLIEPIPFDLILVLIEVIKLFQLFRAEHQRSPSVKEFSRLFGRRKVKKIDEIELNILEDFNTFFTSKKPTELKTKEFNALRYRWGFEDTHFHKLKDTSKYYNISVEDLLKLEIELINRLGFQVKINGSDKSRWLKH